MNAGSRIRRRALLLVTCNALVSVIALSTPAVAKPRIAVDSFTGSRARQLRAEVVKLLSPRYQIVSPAQIAAAIEVAGADFGITTIARLLKVDGFVVGAVVRRRGQWYLQISIHNGKSGREQASREVRLNRRRAWTFEVEREITAWLESELPGETGDDLEQEPPDGAGDASDDTAPNDDTAPGDDIESGGDTGAEGDVADDTTVAAADDPGLDDLDELDELDAELSALEKGTAEKGVTDFRGSLAAEFRTYPLDRNGPKNDEQLLLETEIELSVSLTGGASFFFLPRFLLDTTDTEMERFEPYEGYFQYTGETWDWRAGQFVENWGVADAFNPLDVLNRRDYAPDALDPRPLGELGTRLRKTFWGAGWFGQPTVSLYVMPLWRQTLLPTDDYRYSFSQGPFVLVDDPEEPKLEDGVFGAIRFGHTLNTGLFSADFIYIGARGPSRFPNVTPVPQMDGSVELRTEYFGAWIGGGGFRLVPDVPWWSKLTFKTEVVYVRPYLLEGANKPDRYVQFVAGFDRIFNGLITDLDSVILTIEYLGEELADDLLSQFRPFENDVAVRVFWDAKDFSRTSIELRGVVDVKNGELIGQATIGRQLRFLHDDLSFEILTQWVRPERDEATFFSFFPNNNSNVRARMEFNF